MAGPALILLAVKLLHRVRRADRPAVLSGECREEIDHVQLGVGIAGFEPHGGGDGRMIIAAMRRKLVDEHPLGAVHDGFPRQAQIVEKLPVFRQQIELAPEGHGQPSVWSRGNALNFSMPGRRRSTFSSSSILRGLSPASFSRSV